MENNKQNALKFFAANLNAEIKVNAAIFHAEENSLNADRKKIMSASVLADIHEGIFSHKDFTLLLTMPCNADDEIKSMIANLWDGVAHKTPKDGELIIEDLFELSNRLPAEIIDYLRTKHIAVDWNGLSVKTMIEYGWIKLKSD